MRDLVAGERVAVGDPLVIRLDPPVRPPLALAAIALDARRRAVADWMPLDSLSRELRPAARFDEAGGLHLMLAALPGGVARVAVVAFAAERGARLDALTLCTDAVRFRVPLHDRADAALILAEVYRHGDGWKLAADGGGFAGGLPALAAAFGCDDGWARRLSGGPAPAPERGRNAGASGSGVAVDRHHLLTNAHVVEDAGRIGVAGERGPAAAELVFADPRNDLALLRVAEPMAAAARFRDGVELHLGEEVVALGYPLQGLLGSGPQASAGNVAAASGIGNDTTLFQFIAPIASGNSGGPILDASGLVVGLVTASLNLDSVRASGGNAQLVNFGVKGAVIRSFLDSFGVQPALAPAGLVQARAAMVRDARASLYRVTCA